MPVRNAPSTLPVTLRFMKSRLAHRLCGGTFSEIAGALEEQINAARNQLGGLVRRIDWVEVKPGGDRWTDSGLDLPAGAHISLLAEGAVFVSRAFDVAITPKVGLWFRIGEDALAKIVGNGSSVEVAEGGRLRFTAKPPGEFASPGGNFEPGLTRAPLSGGFRVAVIQWARSLDESLLLQRH
jgi:hypothetical protein